MCPRRERQREIVNDALWTTRDREDKRQRLLLLLPLASSLPTVANDAENGHLCDMYDIYFYQWYWGISVRLVWFTQQGENNFQGCNLLWKLLIRHICVCVVPFSEAAIFASCHTQGATQFWAYRIYDRISFLTFLFSGSQQFLTSRRGRGGTDALDLCPQWLVCVCVCASVLGLLAFRALWSDILINSTLACSNGPTCNREQSA